MLYNQPWSQKICVLSLSVPQNQRLPNETVQFLNITASYHLMMAFPDGVSVSPLAQSGVLPVASASVVEEHVPLVHPCKDGGRRFNSSFQYTGEKERPRKRQHPITSPNASTYSFSLSRRPQRGSGAVSVTCSLVQEPCRDARGGVGQLRHTLWSVSSCVIIIRIIDLSAHILTLWFRKVFSESTLFTIRV